MLTRVAQRKGWRGEAKVDKLFCFCFAVTFFFYFPTLADATMDPSPVPEQKTLVLVNTFVAQTVQMLNRFSSTCEQKLADAQRCVSDTRERERAHTHKRKTQQREMDFECVVVVAVTGRRPPPSFAPSHRHRQALTFLRPTPPRRCVAALSQEVSFGGHHA